MKPAPPVTSNLGMMNDRFAPRACQPRGCARVFVVFRYRERGKGLEGRIMNTNNLQQLLHRLRLRPRNASPVAACLALAVLSACGDGTGAPAALKVSSEPGPSPFISLVHLSGLDHSRLARVRYTIAAKPGSVSRPVHVEYARAAL